MELQLTQSHDTLTAVISGSFTFTDNPVFSRVLSASKQPDIQYITLNLTKVEYIDSAGLGMLLMLRDHCNQIGQQLILFSPTGQVEKVFSVAKFDELFQIESLS